MMKHFSNLSLIFALLALPLSAQDTNVFIPDGSIAPDGTLEAMRFMVSNALAQYGEVISTNANGSNEVDQADSSNNDGSDTNFVTDAQGHIHRESRSEWLDRQRARQASAVASAQARDAGQSGSANQRDDTPARPDYSAFRLVYERNIFDPNRRPSRIREPRQPSSRVESFSLVGTMSYDKGTFAFFDGTRSDYKKALKLADSIAGYKITNITPDAVNLASGTNQVELRVGTQMRSEEGGPWVTSSQVQSYSDTPSNTPSNSSVASSTTASHSSSTDSSSNGNNGNESDVIKRMMQRREQE